MSSDKFSVFLRIFEESAKIPQMVLSEVADV